MQNLISVLGMVIKQEPVGEFDRKIVIMTREKGKITVYARGARRQNNRLMAATNLFAFGEFRLFANPNSYSLSDASISNFFEEMRTDLEASFYGLYFLEITDYYCREGVTDTDMLKLLYQSLKALFVPQFTKDFVKTLFEIKAIMINGEFNGIPDNDGSLEGTRKAVRFLYDTPADKIYSFKLSDESFTELRALADANMKDCGWKDFKSLELIEGMK